MDAVGFTVLLIVVEVAVLWAVIYTAVKKAIQDSRRSEGSTNF